MGQLADWVLERPSITCPEAEFVHGFPVLYTTTPPHSAHFVGLEHKIVAKAMASSGQPIRVTHKKRVIFVP
jgi:hypothetical protein